MSADTYTSIYMLRGRNEDETKTWYWLELNIMMKMNFFL